MKKINYCLMVIVSISTLQLGGCKYGITSNTLKDFKYEIENNLSIVGKNNQLLANPDRGFRGEIYLTLGRGGIAYPESTQSVYELLDEQLSLENANIKVVQTYVYLIEYYNSDIPQSALDELKDLFLAFQQKGIKMLLRFAYEYTDSLKIGPTTSRIESHCKQLKSWIAENKELFLDTVFSVQLGMIGLWGEGHGSVHHHKPSRIIKAVCDMVPEEINVMVRTPDFYKSASVRLRKRLTIHDDFLVGIEHEWGIDVAFDSREYKELTKMTRKSICDGEMPWGRDTTVDNIDMMLFLRQIKNYGLTTLSLAHNYMEGDDYNNYELYTARDKYITKDELINENMPFNPYMLVDDKISYFDYINYHLGYQLALSNYSITDKKLSLLINNFGLACPIGYKMEVYADDQLILSKLCEDMDLYQFGQHQLVLKGDFTNKALKLRFVSTRDKKTIALANDLVMQDGYYIIK